MKAAWWREMGLRQRIRPAMASETMRASGGGGDRKLIEPDARGGGGRKHVTGNDDGRMRGEKPRVRRGIHHGKHLAAADFLDLAVAVALVRKRGVRR